MAMFHCSIKIIGRSKGRSAIASAAYRSGERLYNEETGLIHDFTRKGGVVMSEIMLPENAPEEYKDRQKLWTEVQKIEKRSDAQLAREVEVAFPVEMSRDEQIECVRAFIYENFVSKGMCADFAIHDVNGENPHAHIMLTVRGFDENGNWTAKQKTVYALDENGNRIPQIDPKTGEQKVRVRKGRGTEKMWVRVSVPSNDWNDHKKAEEWRASWAEHCNRYLDKDRQIDHRSYKRQGIDREPTIHEGVTARQMERDGKVADRCEINRRIRQRNSIREELKKMAKEITDYIIKKAGELYGRFKEFTRSAGHSKSAGSDVGYSGRAAERQRAVGDAVGKSGADSFQKREGDRKSQERETKSPDRKGTSFGRKGRVRELNQHIRQLEREIAEAESAIADTDRRIKEIKQLIRQREEVLYDRISSLRKRHKLSEDDGRDTGRQRETSGREGGTCGSEQTLSERAGADADQTEIRKSRYFKSETGERGYFDGVQGDFGQAEVRSTGQDIRTLLTELSVAERTSEEKRDNLILERTDREVVRERYRSEAERGTEKTEQPSGARDVRSPGGSSKNRRGR